MYRHVALHGHFNLAEPLLSIGHQPSSWEFTHIPYTGNKQVDIRTYKPIPIERSLPCVHGCCHAATRRKNSIPPSVATKGTLQKKPPLSQRYKHHTSHSSGGSSIRPPAQRRLKKVHKSLEVCQVTPFTAVPPVT